MLGFNMFAYCNNNPVNYLDNSGKNPDSVQVWTGTMWWLCGLDGPLPVGEIIYGAGIVILGIYVLIAADEIATPQISLEQEEGKSEPEPPDVTYPGDNPAEAPDGYEWKGPDEQGGKRGGYKNPNGKDSWHPDLDHPDGIPPHWDYNDGFGHKWRVFPDHIEIVLN